MRAFARRNVGRRTVARGAAAPFGAVAAFGEAPGRSIGRGAALLAGGALQSGERGGAGDHRGASSPVLRRRSGRSEPISGGWFSRQPKQRPRAKSGGDVRWLKSL